MRTQSGSVRRRNVDAIELEKTMIGRRELIGAMATGGGRGPGRLGQRRAGGERGQGPARGARRAMGRHWRLDHGRRASQADRRGHQRPRHRLRADDGCAAAGVVSGATRPDLQRRHERTHRPRPQGSMADRCHRPEARLALDHGRGQRRVAAVRSGDAAGARACCPTNTNRPTTNCSPARRRRSRAGSC